MSDLLGTGPSHSDLTLRCELSKAMASSGKDRLQIAKELSQLTGGDITVSKLNDYTATTKAGARFPASYVKAFCVVTRNDALLRLLLTPKISALLQVGECELEAQRQQRAKSGVIKELLEEGKDRGL